MWNMPGRQRLAKIPRLYETENIPLREKQIHLHFFICDLDWYVCEFDGDDTFWGFAITDSVFDVSEWGYFRYSQLRTFKINGWIEVDCELESIWKIRRAKEIEKISLANGWSQKTEPISRRDQENEIRIH